MNEFGAVLLGAATLSTPLVLASLAGLLSERSGVINIALEGKMLAAACVTALVTIVSGSPVLGLAAGIAAAALVAMFHLWLVESFRIDHVVSGIGINALALGGTTFLVQSLPSFRDGRIEGIPFFVFGTLAVAAAGTCWLLFAKMAVGLQISAVGNSPEKARLNGINPIKIRIMSLLGTGILCGIAGAMLVSDAGGFVINLTSGRGYIALAALILGRWKPIPAAATSVIFGIVQSLQLTFQGTPLFGVAVPSEVWQALPYGVTLLALAVFMGDNKAPGGLGKP